MKVICIYGSKEGEPTEHLFGYGIVRKEDEVYEGHYYNVIESKDWHGLVYRLEERPPYNWYDAKRFAPLSDLDETEIHNIEKEQLVEVK